MIIEYIFNKINFTCPVCGKPLSVCENGKSLVCVPGSGEKKHCFDISSSGYVNLLTGHGGSGDSKECVKSRTAFLGTGHYENVSDVICELTNKYYKDGSIILDAGCGEGYYTNNIAKANENCHITGIDISKFAVESGAKQSKRAELSNVCFAVSGIFDLPFADASLDGIVNLFAPCAETEFCRVLKDGGILIVGGAGTNHLFGFKKALYDTPYKNEKRADLPQNMKLLERKNVLYKITLAGDEILNLFAMTPYYYRTSEADRQKLASLNELETEVEVEFLVYRKNG